MSHKMPNNAKRCNNHLLHLFVCWDTRTRTKNDRTRICSVTITPYPNISATRSLIASAKVRIKFETQTFFAFFFNKI